MGNAFGCDACGAEGNDLKPPRSFSLPPTIMRPSGSVPEGWSLGDKLLEFRRGISDSDLDAIDKAELLARFDAEVQKRVRESGGPVRCAELWKSMDNLWDRYPANVESYMLLEGHLKSLLRRGVLSGALDDCLSWVGSDRNTPPLTAQAAQGAVYEMRNI